MHIVVNKSLQNVTLNLKGRFDYDARRDFDSGTQQALNEAPGLIVVNLQDVDYMDSSALGMLLVLRDKAKEKGKSVSLTGGQGLVRKILEVANFNRLFETT